MFCFKFALITQQFCNFQFFQNIDEYTIAFSLEMLISPKLLWNTSILSPKYLFSKNILVSLIYDQV